MPLLHLEAEKLQSKQHQIDAHYLTIFVVRDVSSSSSLDTIWFALDPFLTPFCLVETVSHYTEKSKLVGKNMKLCRKR
jgi:hypothetical protein